MDADAVLLAAGLSRRMGARNKLLLPVAGEPMVRRMARLYLDATGRVIVVTGHQRDAVEAALAGLPVSFVHNAAFEEGQAGSVAAGLARAEARVTLVGLADQPRLTAADLARLLSAHAGADPDLISVPVSDGRRGNPVAVPGPLRPRLIKAGYARPDGRFTRDHPGLVQRLPLDAPGFYHDVDTPEAYDELTGPEDR